MTSDPAFVLYVDHQDHPAPLSECFHATASRRLSSTVDRQHRPSTITQADSAYCPHSMGFHDASSAAQLGYCPKPECVQCPLCMSMVSCQKVDSTFCFTCGRCDWNSIPCGLKVDTSSESEATKDEVMGALAQLATMLQEKRKAGGHASAAEEHYQKMVEAFETVVKKPLPKSSTTRGFQINNAKRDGDPWSVDALETELQKKKTASAEDVQNAIGGQALTHISLEEPQTLDAALAGQRVSTFALQAWNSAPTMSMADLLPLPIPLRSRNSRRCRAELAEGKPGILLKPKLNPLEGDSSLRTGHGQWWKKDSSAVHVVPRVRAIRHGSKAQDGGIQLHCFVLKVTNSTLGVVRLQISLSSAYKGEHLWDKDEHTKKNPAMENLLVETLTNKHVDAYLFTPSSPEGTTTDQSSSTLKSDVVALDSAEDAIVDIGKVFEVPEEVLNWDPEKALNDSSPASEAMADLEENHVRFLGISMLAEKSGSAWFEMICATKEKPGIKTESSNLSLAIPLALQIEVGNGSWESSLIKANPTEEGQEPDKVTFDLVVTWPSTP
ncbi:Dynactin p62 family [Seminavis robusta]|uniref:Dynactin subunit 4 n=1 Tax=Seminavis robusta TaxID=568900 RepID=A0A9N8HL27_9STRA|nr:Dynactin p62 family [Seminavis robusta]|eukprot:Sro777_g201000.1 Dynactin p62 family (553) ;mRNA; r:13059-14812